MGLKRIITDEEKALIPVLKRYKGRKISQMSQKEKDDLLEMIAKKLNLL